MFCCGAGDFGSLKEGKCCGFSQKESITVEVCKQPEIVTLECLDLDVMNSKAQFEQETVSLRSKKNAAVDSAATPPAATAAAPSRCRETSDERPAADTEEACQNSDWQRLVGGPTFKERALAEEYGGEVAPAGFNEVAPCQLNMCDGGDQPFVPSDGCCSKEAAMGDASEAVQSVGSKSRVRGFCPPPGGVSYRMDDEEMLKTVAWCCYWLCGGCGYSDVQSALISSWQCTCCHQSCETVTARSVTEGCCSCTSMLCCCLCLQQLPSAPKTPYCMFLDAPYCGYFGGGCQPQGWEKGGTSQYEQEFDSRYVCCWCGCCGCAKGRVTCCDLSTKLLCCKAAYGCLSNPSSRCCQCITMCWCLYGHCRLPITHKESLCACCGRRRRRRQRK
eukprot:TRINITY_DN17125_c0_g2_i1.p1 TRINITY_DN17125_c0_g2~~TRINITY_DN17125_c0_g2_i1.p1  ORF type:complete len:389 (-),score=59.17 TRINITY_DN17125_c0_g2_i1:492-1658(-)